MAQVVALEAGAKRPPIWQQTVELPSAKETPAAPAFVVNFRGRSHWTDRLDDLDLTNLAPTRKFVHQTGRRNAACRPYLPDTGARIAVESGVEQVEALLESRDPSVHTVLPQGAWAKVRVTPLKKDGTRGKPAWRWSCVDFLVQRHDGTITAIESKRCGFTFKPRTAPKLLATADAFEAAGITYRLMEGLDIVQENNFWQMALHSRTWLAQTGTHRDLRVRIGDAANGRPVTYGDLCQVGTPTFAAAVVWELLWTNTLCVDWAQPITDSTPIRRHGSACEAVTGESEWDFDCGPQRTDLLPDLRDWMEQW